MLKSKLLSKYPGLEHYFFEKKDLKEKKYQKLIEKAIHLRQIHSNKVLVINRGEESQYFNFRKGDGVITNKKISLCIETADCLPIFLFDSENFVIAAIHAGWRGLAKGIIEVAIEKMRKRGSSLAKIIAAVGPHIGKCCYWTAEKRLLQFGKSFSSGAFSEKIGSFFFLDLGKIAYEKFLRVGLSKENIEISSVCTFCDNRFFSFRREGNLGKRMPNIIGLKEERQT